MTTTTATLAAMVTPFVAGFWRSVFSSWGSVLLVMLGSLTIAMSLVAFVQTRTWPRAETVPSAPAEDDEQTGEAAPNIEAAPPAKAPTPRPATTTDLIRMRFPQISERHPDVWDHEAPLEVVVDVDRDRFPTDATVQVVLGGQHEDHRRVFGTVDVPRDGRAPFKVQPGRRGEVDLVAALNVDAQPEGQAVRAIRLVDYRAEIIETFEDFVTWAATQFRFVDRKRTAREFIDMYIDGKPGTPAAPLDEIVDIYEVANFSDHPVDRTTYLRLVDAFLELEEAGALEGTEEA